MMTPITCYWDDEEKCQKERDCTPAEIAEIEANQTAAAANAQTVLIASYVGAIQDRLDAFARERGYDGILSLCSYATSTSPRFSAEGTRGVANRDDTWIACYALLAAVEAGQRPVPTLMELLAELPPLTWPT